MIFVCINRYSRLNVVKMSNDLNRAVLQLLIGHGYIKDSELVSSILLLEKEFSIDKHNRTIADIFHSINESVRHLSLEVKSVYITKANNERVMYHGLVNIEEDLVTQEFGSHFDASELNYFSHIVTRMLEDRYLSSNDISHFKPARWNDSRVLPFLNKLENEGWLQRNDSNYLILGVRSYLELRAYMESVIMSSDDLEQLTPAEKEERTNELRNAINNMPQIILY